MKKSDQVKRLLLYLTLSCSILVAIYLFSTFVDIPVNRDAGYYIPVSKAVMNGATPTVDVQSGYTPFIYYAYSLWMSICGTNYSTLTLLVYLANITNALLLYFIFCKFIDNTILRIFLCISYYYTEMICQGIYIILEPFQILFILVAYNLYLSNMQTWTKYSLMGLSIGISIMFKQYSALFLIAFLLTICIDFRKSQKPVGTLLNIFIFLVFSALPFLIFILFTKANIVSSLYAFGFIGKNAVSYATAHKVGFLTWSHNIANYIILYNWLFVPALLYVYLRILHKGFLNSSISVGVIFLFSALPILIRQWGHYFLLIAPWSYILWGILLNEVVKKFFEKKGDSPYPLLAGFISVLIILPALLLLRSSVWDISGSQMTLILILFLLPISIVLFWETHFSKNGVYIFRLIFILALIFGSETLFISFLKMPWKQMRELKQFQRVEAKKVNNVFARGSSVFVIDYPELYVTCDFINPLNNYSFIYSPNDLLKFIKSHYWINVRNIVLKSKSSAYLKELNEKGFRQLKGPQGLNLSLFTNAN